VFLVPWEATSSLLSFSSLRQLPRELVFFFRGIIRGSPSPLLDLFTRPRRIFRTFFPAASYSRDLARSPFPRPRLVAKKYWLSHSWSLYESRLLPCCVLFFHETSPETPYSRDLAFLHCCVLFFHETTLGSPYSRDLAFFAAVSFFFTRPHQEVPIHVTSPSIPAVSFFFTSPNSVP